VIRGLYGIADADFGDPVALALQLLEGGVETLQVRCKKWSASQVGDVLQEIAPLCAAQGCLLLVNDHLELAPLAGGLHLGQEDGAVLRADLPPGALLGRSTHDEAQIQAALVEGVDYIGFGPVFGSRTKATGYSPRGLLALQSAVEAAGNTPVVAIGGITEENLPDVRQSGVQAWAPISALLGQGDIVAATRRFRMT
jgi:thiamine-phosphate pyrophosphorylase